MEIKIVCECGQKYIFEVDPENGQMPASVNCPACGADGTKEANDILTQIFPEPSSEPAAESAVEAAEPSPVSAAAGPLRINPPVRLAVAASTPPSLPANVPALQAVRPMVATPLQVKSGGEFSLGLGILGAIVGAAVGAGLMYGFFEWAGFRFPLMGCGIGALAGLGARIGARDTEMSLGIIAGMIAMVATAGTLYLMFGEMAGMFFISTIVSVSVAYRVAG